MDAEDWLNHRATLAALRTASTLPRAPAPYASRAPAAGMPLRLHNACRQCLDLLHHSVPTRCDCEFGGAAAPTLHVSL